MLKAKTLKILFLVLAILVVFTLPIEVNAHDDYEPYHGAYPQAIFHIICKDVTDNSNIKVIKEFDENLDFFEAHWMGDDKLYISYKVRTIDVDGYVPSTSTYPQLVVLTYNKGESIPNTVNGTVGSTYMQATIQTQESTSKTQTAISNVTEGTIVVKYTCDGREIYPKNILTKQTLNKDIVLSAENIKGYKTSEEARTVKLSEQNPDVNIEFLYNKIVNAENNKIVKSRTEKLVYISIACLLIAIPFFTKKSSYKKKQNNINH